MTVTLGQDFSQCSNNFSFERVVLLVSKYLIMIRPGAFIIRNLELKQNSVISEQLSVIREPLI